jgi:hypothetical protein
VLGLMFAACRLQVVTVVVEDYAETVVEGLPEGIPAGSVPFELDLPLELGEALQEQGLREGDLSSVVLQGLHLEVLEPKEQDLGFLRELVLLVDADGLSAETVASGVPVQGARELELELTEVELLEFLLSPGMMAFTDVRGELPSEDTALRLSYEVQVSVTVQGLVSQL